MVYLSLNSLIQTNSFIRTPLTLKWHTGVWIIDNRGHTVLCSMSLLLVNNIIIFILKYKMRHTAQK